MFFAHMFELLGEGKVVTIDVENQCCVEHQRIMKLIGSSTSHRIEAEVNRIVGDATCMVFLDSLHNKQHVLKEMEAYSALVKKGHYLVVGDTNVNGHPVLPRYSETIEGKRFDGGPMEAVAEFLRTRDEFSVDRSREEKLFTLFPGGFLRRMR